MRVVTYAEAVRRRYGGATEQFYVWIQVPVSLVKSGIELSALGVFMAAVFRTDVLPTIVVLGGVVILVAMLGGAWAVVAGDFLQSLLMLLVLVLATCFVLRRPEIGGVSGLLAKLSPEQLGWGRRLRTGVLVTWCAATFLNSFFNFNNLAEGAARFLTVKNEREARKAALAMAGCFVFIPVLLLTPALASTLLLPDLHAAFPALRNPQEGAFVAACLRVMPAGVVGLLVAGIFAVAMASMDTGLNRNSGLLIRNVYQRFVRPLAPDRELLLASKTCTVALGLAIVGVAALVSVYSRLDLFNLILTFSSLVGLPLMIPTVFGLFVRRAPTWAGWSTLLVGLATGWTLRATGGVERLADALGWSARTPLETTSLAYGITVLVVAGACAGWFALATALAQPANEPEHVREFFADLARPIGLDDADGKSEDGRQFRTMGLLCLTYGGGIAAFAALPNAAGGRVAFLACGAAIAGVGVVLRGWRRAPEVAVA